VDRLLKLSRVIDAVNDTFGVIAVWLVLIACLISAGNAGSRYLFSASSNAWLEVQWYMFAGMVLLGAPYTLKVNEHVRVDLRDPGLLHLAVVP
jgi:TRAP-type mannitol/chloroaromatic compound transport system permease small subunit